MSQQVSAYRVGLALGGGAARGWSHIGVIEALLEAGIVPRVVAGTSMGALIGGAYACGRLDALKAWALRVNRRTIARLLDINLATGGLIEGEGIRALLVELGLERRIEDLPLRYAAVATHLANGREIWLDKGNLTDAIRASIAMPGIISPCLVGGRWLSDGGLVNQIPVSTCRALGADFIIAVDVGNGLLEKHAAELRQPSRASGARLAEYLPHVPDAFRPQAERLLSQMLPARTASPKYLSVLMISLSIMQDKITRSRLAGEPPHAMIAPPVAHVSLMDFDRADEAIARGREATLDALAAIRGRIFAQPG